MSGHSEWSKRRRINGNLDKVVSEICDEAATSGQFFVSPQQTPEQSVYQYITNNACPDAGHSPQKSEELWHTAEVDIDDLENNDYDFCDSDDDDVNNADQSDNDVVDTDKKLAFWYTENRNVSMKALTGLLSILHPRCPELPKDARTLLQTVKAADFDLSIQIVSNGSYYHFGLASGIKRQLSLPGVETALQHNHGIAIQVNVDGVPLFKSTNGQFWPILCRLDQPVLGQPFVVGLFYGQSKPKNLEFLDFFIREYKELKNNGLSYGTDKMSVRISSFICDAPARAFLKNIKMHTAYSGCERCMQSGVWNGKMTFPSVSAAMRTDESFCKMADSEHHRGESPLTNIGIGMVSEFVLDYMHLICLGVVRRLVWLWLCGPLTLNCRMGAKTVQSISDELISVKTFIPTEFARKPRSLSEWQRWKATEYRQFLLYTGPIVLHGKLPDATYKNFLLLSVGIRMLLEKSLDDEYIIYARSLLVLFVTHYSQLYGDAMVVYNVHNVIHLADDFNKFGCLDKISAFAFENYLGQLVKLVRKPHKPLEQVVRRLHERNQAVLSDARPFTVETPVTSHEYCGGFVPHGFGLCKQYKKVNISGFTLSTDSGNNCIDLSGDIVLVRNILVNGSGTFLVYQKFCKQHDFFTYPLNSSVIGIYIVSGLSSVMSIAPLSHFTKKNVLLPHLDFFVVVPFIGM